MYFLRPLTAVTLAALLPAAAFATSFDGLYKPAGTDYWTCDPERIGEDRHAVAIQGDKLFGVENTCTLTNAVPVREMNATLYDAKCAAEGATYAYRIILMRHANGVYVIEDGFASEWLNCP
ncbi:hypothetical protein [Shimia haliotis]|uniref:Uncharacterized protein n=1 Tax=Shimia haliotis TaxID=1280847 RepID=A0A1I4DFU2_9RHOB|nr:hypothetical protein [Shimia haliotis]SFK92362.1 hypothetical protein SAMN04488036_103147 [Shimia haliotis]